MYTPDPNDPYLSQMPYDPLAANFLAGGRMGYMPQAQFLTPPQYGAFRTMPGAQMQQTPMARGTLWQNYLVANQGTPFGLGGVVGPYMFDTYSMAQDELKYRIMSQRRVSDAWSAVQATGLGLGLQAGLGFGGFAGLGLGLVMPDVGGAYLDRLRQGRDIQNLSMSRIVAGPDMAGAFGQGFSLRAATRLDSRLRRLSAQDTILKEDDYRNILRGGVENGLFDYASSAGQYGEILEKLTKSVKIINKMLEGKGLPELLKEMKRLQDMGAGLDQQVGAVALETMYARTMGISHADMVSSYGQSGALIYAQRGLTPYLGGLAGAAEGANIALQQRLGLTTPGMVARAGGVSGLQERRTAADADAWGRLGPILAAAAANKDFSGLDKDVLGQAMSGKLDYRALINRAGSRLGRVEDFTRFSGSKAELMQQAEEAMGPLGRDVFFAQTALQEGRRINPKGSAQEQLMAGYLRLDFSEEDARAKAAQYANPEYLRAMQTQYQVQAMRTQEDVRAQRLREQQWRFRIQRMYREFGLDVFENYLGPMLNTSAGRKDFEEGAKVGISNMQGYDMGRVAMQHMSFDEYKALGTSSAGRSRPTLGYEWMPGGYQPEDLSQIARSFGSDISVIAEMSESSFGRVLHGWDKRGGHSYGVIQLNQDNAQSFVRGSKWAGAFGSLRADDPEFAKRWMQLEKSDPEFRKAQIDWNTAHNYQPMVEGLAKAGITGLDKLHPVVQQSLYSLATQFGFDSRMRIARQALAGVDLNDSSPMNQMGILQRLAELRRQASPATASRYDRELRFATERLMTDSPYGEKRGNFDFSYATERGSHFALLDEYVQASRVSDKDMAAVQKRFAERGTYPLKGRHLQRIADKLQGLDDFEPGKIKDAIASVLKEEYPNISEAELQSQVNELFNTTDFRRLLFHKGKDNKALVETADQAVASQVVGKTLASDKEWAEAFNSLHNKLFAFSGKMGQADADAMSAVSGRNPYGLAMHGLEAAARQLQHYREGTPEFKAAVAQVQALGKRFNMSDEQIRQILEEGTASSAAGYLGTWFGTPDDVKAMLATGARYSAKKRSLGEIGAIDQTTSALTREKYQLGKSWDEHKITQELGRVGISLGDLDSEEAINRLLGQNEDVKRSPYAQEILMDVRSLIKSGAKPSLEQVAYNMNQADHHKDLTGPEGRIPEEVIKGNTEALSALLAFMKDLKASGALEPRQHAGASGWQGQ